MKKGINNSLRSELPRTRLDETSRALKSSEEKFEALSEQSPSMIFINKGGRVVYANRKCEEVMGYKREEFYAPGFDFFTLIAPEYIRQLKVNFKKHMKGRDIPPLEYTLITKGGKRIEAVFISKLIDYEDEHAILGIVTDVSELKSAERALRDSEERFRSMAELSPFPISIIDPDGRYLYLNKKFTEVFGYTHKDIPMGRKWFKKAFPDAEYRKLAVDTWLSDLRSAKPNEERPRSFRVRCKDGRKRDISFIPVMLTDGKQYIVYEDITEKKEAEEALKESEELYRTLVETSPYAIVRTDLDLKIIFCNHQASVLFGFDNVEDMSGKPVESFFSREDRKRALEDARNTARSWKAGQYEYVMLKKDGASFFAELNVSLVVDGSGRPSGFMYSVRDISEQERAEKLLVALNEASAAMQKALTQEEIFDAIAKKLRRLGFHCVIFTVDEEQSALQIVYFSYAESLIKMAEKLLGVDRTAFSVPLESTDLLRRAILERKTYLVKNALPLIREILPKRSKQFAERIQGKFNIPHSIVAPLMEGEKVIGLLSVQSKELVEEDVPAITAFANQMSSSWRKARLMQQLEESVKDLKRTQGQLVHAQKMEAVGRLAGGVAHDFNNLLTVINGYSSLVLENLESDAPVRNDIEEIKKAGERAANLTARLLTFSRKQIRQPKILNMNEVVKNIQVMLSRMIGEDIELITILDENLWSVKADPSHIEQVIMNLAVNARDVMPDGGKLTIETANVSHDEVLAAGYPEIKPGQYILLAVRDTGLGMSRENIEHIFEPFFTTKEQGKGTGLGLSMAYGIVKQSNGYIFVRSEPGEGAAFNIYLPRLKEDREVPEAEDECTVVSAPTGGETILLVEDEKVIRKYTKTVLQNQGYTVLPTGDGEEALNISETHPDIIPLLITDVVMPKMGGKDLAQKLVKKNPLLKVIFISGYTEDDVIQHGILYAGINYIQKPFTREKLLKTVRAVLDSS